MQADGFGSSMPIRLLERADIEKINGFTWPKFEDKEFIKKILHGDVGEKTGENFIEFICSKKIPKNFYEFSRLVTYVLFQFPKLALTLLETGQPAALELYYMQEKPLNILIDSLEKIPCIEKLIFEDMMLSYEMIAKFIAQNYHLKTCRFYGDPEGDSDIESMWKKVVDAVAKNPTLQSLAFPTYPISVDGLICFLEVVTNHPNLEEIEISIPENMPTTVIIDFINKATNIKYVDIFNGFCTVHLREMLPKLRPSRNLTFFNCGISLEYCDADLLESVCHFLSENESLTEFMDSETIFDSRYKISVRDDPERAVFTLKQIKLILELHKMYAEPAVTAYTNNACVAFLDHLSISSDICSVFRNFLTTPSAMKLASLNRNVNAAAERGRFDGLQANLKMTRPSYQLN